MSTPVLSEQLGHLNVLPWSHAERIDAAIRVGAPVTSRQARALADALRQRRIHGAVAYFDFLDRAGQDHTIDAFLRYAPRVMCVPLLDPSCIKAVELQRSWINRGIRAISLATLGSFQSPMRWTDPQSIESAKHWDIAAFHQQVICFEPTVEDASLLVPLAMHYSRVRVLVRGGLISKMPSNAPSVLRVFPTPDRFTFDRLHQLNNVWILLSPSNSSSIPTSPSGKPTGWHDPGNLLALFSSLRVLWGSNQTIEDILSNPQQFPDPTAEVGLLENSELLDLSGRTARHLFHDD